MRPPAKGRNDGPRRRGLPERTHHGDKARVPDQRSPIQAGEATQKGPRPVNRMVQQLQPSQGRPDKEGQVGKSIWDTHVPSL